jgi:hypothetical protein
MPTFLKTSFFRYNFMLFLLAVLIPLRTGMPQASQKSASSAGESDKAKFAVLGGYWESEQQGERAVYRAEGSNFFIANNNYEGLYGTLSGELDSMAFRFAKEYVESLSMGTKPQPTAEVRQKFMDYVLGTSERVVFTQTDVNGTNKDVLNIYGQNGSLVDHAFRLDEAAAKARIEKFRASRQGSSAPSPSPGK